MTLWLTAGLLMAISLTVLVWPLLGRHRPDTEDPELMVYTDQLEETKRDVERGLLSEQDAGNLRVEITRRIDRLSSVRESYDAGTDETAAMHVDRAVIAVVSAILLVGSFGVYANLGSPDKRDLPLSARSAGPQIEPTAETAQTSDLNQLADNLADKLAAQPNNLNGWMLLGRTFMTLDRWKDATGALARAYRLSPDGPDVAASFAEALYMANGRSFKRQSKAVLQAALKANPRDAKSLFYWGLAQALDKEHGAALQTWTNLRAISQSNAPWLSVLTRRMQESARAGGIDIATLKPTLAPMGSARPANQQERGPSHEDVKAAQQLSPEDRMAFIRSMVDGLAQRLQDNPNDLAGWKRLARAYQVLGDSEKARAAETRISELEQAAP